jgi:L-histidine N-alpha-methyltransferase
MDISTPQDFDKDFAADVANGLSTNPKYLPTRYIYDDEGSRLFERIMQQEEYYLTNAEIDLLEQHKANYCELLQPQPVDVVELGAGNGEKTSILLEYFVNTGCRFNFRPLDISKQAIDRLTQLMGEKLPSLTCQGMVADYFEGLDWLNTYNDNKRLVLFLGSNIGNFEPQQRQDFLQALKGSLNRGDQVAIGFDFKKETSYINKAYNDANGVTEAFNKNILKRVNAELGGDFDPQQFKFYAAYNPFQGAVQSTLMAKKAQQVKIEALDQSFRFDEWEPVHTESSYKFSENEIKHLADENGFYQEALWKDSRSMYGNAIWTV